MMIARVQYLALGLAMGFIIGHLVGGGMFASSAMERKSLKERIDELQKEQHARDQIVLHLRGRLKETTGEHAQAKVEKQAAEHALHEAIHMKNVEEEVLEHNKKEEQEGRHQADNSGTSSAGGSEGSAEGEPPLPSYDPEGLQLPLARARNNTIIVIPLNSGYLAFGLNLVCSLRKLGIHNYAILAMDKHVLAELLQRKLPVYADPDLPFVSSKAAAWAQANFHRLVCTKLVPVTNLLKKGLNVLLTDADIVWKQNPAAHIRWDLSLTFSIGSCHKDLPDNMDLSRDKVAKLNTGFYFAKSSPAVIDLFSRAYKICQKGTLTGDQPAINTAIHQDISRRSRKYTYGFFSGCLFANGCVYFKHLCGDNLEPVIVHANFLVGKGKKIKSLMKHGLWDEKCINRLGGPNVTAVGS